MARRKTPARSRGAGRKKRSRKAQIQFVANRLLGIEPESNYQALNRILKEVYEQTVVDYINSYNLWKDYFTKESPCPNE